MSEEITPANAVQCAESWNFAIWAELGGGIPELVSALVARVKELEKQRDAAVAGLRTVGPTSTMLDWIHAVLQALAALGAEDTDI